jgi:ribosomal protein S12 methylthiotransferase accessory factor YcaO
MKADFKCAVDERLAYRIQWAGNRCRAWAAEAFVGQFGKDADRIRARMSALGEAEEAQSNTGGLLRRYVGAMTRFDKGNRCRLLSR